MPRPLSLALVALACLSSPVLAGDESESIPPADLPANVLSSIESVHSGTTVHHVVKTTSANAPVVYDVAFAANDGVGRIFVSSEGRIGREERVLGLSKTPAPVQKAVEGYDVWQVFAVFPASAAAVTSYELVAAKGGEKHYLVIDADGAVAKDEELDTWAARIHAIHEELDALAAARDPERAPPTQQQKERSRDLHRDLRRTQEWLVARVIRVGTSKTLVRAILGDTHGDNEHHDSWSYPSSPGPDELSPCIYVLEFHDDVVVSRGFQRSGEAGRRD